MEALSAVTKDEAAEKEVIGAVMLSEGEAYHVASMFLKSSDFNAIQHRSIWDAYGALIAKGISIDPASTLAAMKEAGADKHLRHLGDEAYLSELVSFTYTPSNVEYHARKVAECAERRAWLAVADKIRGGLSVQPFDHGEYVRGIEVALLAASQRRVIGDVIYDAPRLVAAFRETLQNRKANAGAPTGVTTGYRELDEVTRGFQPGELYVIAARPSVGKTAYSLNIAVGAALQGAACLFFSLEMSRQSLMDRIVAAEGRVGHESIKRANFETRDWTRIEFALNRIHESGLSVDDSPALAVADIRSRVQRWMRFEAVKKASRHIIVIDYLGKMAIQRTRDVTKSEAIGQIVSDLKDVAKQAGAPTVVLCQLNRDAAKETRRPRLSDLRDSGNIEEHADFVAFLHREDYYTKPETPTDTAELIIEKHRNGPTPTIDMKWQPAFQRFEEIR